MDVRRLDLAKVFFVREGIVGLQSVQHASDFSILEFYM